MYNDSLMLHRNLPAGEAEPIDIPENVTYEALPFPANFHKGIDALPVDTHIAIAATTNQKIGGLQATFDRAEEAADKGFVNLGIHLAAKAVQGAGHLDELLDRASAAGVTDVLVIGGDADYDPNLPYPDSLSLLEAMASHGQAAMKVGVAGYPGGHPNPDVDRQLTDDLLKKQELSDQFANGMYIETQFDFSAQAVLQWIETTRADGIKLPIKAGLFGVVGPAKARRAMEFAGGSLKAVEFMRKTHINPLEFVLGLHTLRTIRAAKELASAEADIEGFTINTLNDVARTLQKYGPVHAAARQLGLNAICP